MCAPFDLEGEGLAGLRAEGEAAPEHHVGHHAGRRRGPECGRRGSGWDDRMAKMQS